MACWCVWFWGGRVGHGLGGVVAVWCLGGSWRPREASWGRLGGVLGLSWSRLGAAAAFEACFDAAAAASKRSCIDLQRLRSPLGSIPRRTVLLVLYMAIFKYVYMEGFGGLYSS